MVLVQTSSQIDQVKVYAQGATVRRIASLNLIDGQMPTQIEIANLPLALDDSSVKARIEGENSLTRVSDIRIGLTVPPRPKTELFSLEDELQATQLEIEQLKGIIILIESEIRILNHIKLPDRPQIEEGKAPPPSPLSARLALTDFKDEEIRKRLLEKRQAEKKLTQIQEHLEELQQQKLQASTAKEAKPHELRKTAIISLTYDDGRNDSSVIAEGDNNFPESTLILEYFVPGARWTPTYVCRLDSQKNTASLAVRAFICQQSGEDWQGVNLELSTANPQSWCELPELASLKLGRAQTLTLPRGWRQPPTGMSTLFADYDHYQADIRVTKTRIQKEKQFGQLEYRLSVPQIKPLSSLQIPDLGDDWDVLDRELDDLVSEPEETQAFEAIASEVSAADSFVDFSEEELFSLDESEELFSNEMTQYRGGRNEMAQYLRGREGGSLPVPPPPAPKTVPNEMRQMLRGRISKSLSSTTQESSFLAYGLMRLGEAANREQRGKLQIEQQKELYLEILQRYEVVVNFDVMNIVNQALNSAQKSLSTPLPPGGIQVRKYAGSFDYAYPADGRVDILSDGQFHSVPLTNRSTDVNVRYIVVPREDTNVFRVAQLRNPLSAPLLPGPVDVYVDGEYILSTNIDTVPAQGDMELGLGVEQAIKVARNTSFAEARSGETLVAFNEFHHQITINIANYLPRKANIEIRERVPIAAENAKVDVNIGQVSPPWQEYKQTERDAPIKGGYRWQIEVPGQQESELTAQYTVKTFVDQEIIGGNRREE